MKRLDAALVDLKLSPSRSKAQQMIEAGEIEVLMRGEWKPVLQPSYQLGDDGQIRVCAESRILAYVSRGGLKLEAALDHLYLNVSDWICLDIGISTGGFTDCLLQRGARRVVGVDVGHDQLAEKLCSDPRLSHYEGVNVRVLAEHREILEELGGRPDLCVMDVSFISMELALPALRQTLPAGTRLLALVKPQFEVGAAKLDKGGVVRDPALYVEVEAKIRRALEQFDFSVHDYFPCAVKGQDGNQEFFVHATHR